MQCRGRQIQRVGQEERPLQFQPQLVMLGFGQGGSRQGLCL